MRDYIMDTVELSHIDLQEHNCEHEEGSVCFSDADDDRSTYSSYSQFYSTTGGSVDGFAGGAGASEVSLTVDDDDDCCEGAEVKVHLGKVERICRICHLNLEESSSSGNNEDDGIPMELGCSCKEDLGVAHKHCAETWFKIKGNKICEICNCTARNVSENLDGTQRASTEAEPSDPQRFWQGQCFLNFLLACMVFAFVISWLFHFKMPSSSSP